jgi:hypothetical protein
LISTRDIYRAERKLVQKTLQISMSQQHPAQKAEHYKIAYSGIAGQLAKTLGFLVVKDLLRYTLQQEKRQRLLSQIAESGINYQASRECVEYMLFKNDGIKLVRTLTWN